MFAGSSSLHRKHEQNMASISCPVDQVLNKFLQEKPGNVRSGDVAGYVMHGDPIPIHLAGNCSFRNVRTMLVKCGGAHNIFSCWGFVKDKVNRTPVCDLADSQERIYAAVNNVTPHAS